MSIDYETLDTAQKWIDAAAQVTIDARDAAKSGDKDKMRAAADACSDFINNRTLDCPKDLAHTIAGVQVELSQLIVSDDIGSIKSRSAQFEAYLQDINHLSAAAEMSADLISFKSVISAVGDVTGIVTDLKNVKTQLGKINDVSVAGISTTVQDVMNRLNKIQTTLGDLNPA